MSKATLNKARRRRNARQIVCAVCGTAGDRPLVNRGDSRNPRYEHTNTAYCQLVKGVADAQTYNQVAKRLKVIHNPVLLRPR